MKNSGSFKTAKGTCYPVPASGTLCHLGIQVQYSKNIKFSKVSQKYEFYVKYLGFKYWLKYFLNMPQAK